MVLVIYIIALVGIVVQAFRLLASLSQPIPAQVSLHWLGFWVLLALVSGLYVYKTY